MSNVSTGDIAVVVSNIMRSPCVASMQGFVFKVGSAFNVLDSDPHAWLIDGRPVRCAHCTTHGRSGVFIAFYDADLQRLRPPAEDNQADQPESLQHEVEEGIAHG